MHKTGVCFDWCVVCNNIYVRIEMRHPLCLDCLYKIKDEWIKDSKDSSLDEYYNAVVMAHRLEKS